MSMSIFPVAAALALATAASSSAQDARLPGHPLELAQNAASAICICALQNGNYSAWFRSRPSNWGTPNPLRIAASSCVDTGLCGPIGGVQSYVKGSYTITPSNFQSIGNLHGIIGTLSP